MTSFQKLWWRVLRQHKEEKGHHLNSSNSSTHKNPTKTKTPQTHLFLPTSIEKEQAKMGKDLSDEQVSSMREAFTQLREAFKHNTKSNVIRHCNEIFCIIWINSQHVSNSKTYPKYQSRNCKFSVVMKTTISFDLVEKIKCFIIIVVRWECLNIQRWNLDFWSQMGC